LTTSILIFVIVLYGIIALIGYFFLGGFIFGAGFEPTSKKEIDRAAGLVGLRDGLKVYDLGSGTGSVVLHLAKNYGIDCVGVEVDPLKFWISEMRLKSSGALKGTVRFVRGNLLNADLSGVDVVYIFLSGGSGIMESLKQKILREMKPGSKVVSYVHLFKDWRPSAVEKEIRVYTVERNGMALPSQNSQA
jgi:SAM-dependent methyltransferase